MTQWIVAMALLLVAEAYALKHSISDLINDASPPTKTPSRSVDPYSKADLLLQNSSPASRIYGDLYGEESTDSDLSPDLIDTNTGLVESDTDSLRALQEEVWEIPEEQPDQAASEKSRQEALSSWEQLDREETRLLLEQEKLVAALHDKKSTWRDRRRARRRMQVLERQRDPGKVWREMNQRGTKSASN